MENAKLLHRRLKLLLDSFNSTEERPSTQSLIHQLCRIEEEFDSPKTEESWEEIGDEFRNVEIEPIDQKRAITKGKKALLVTYMNSHAKILSLLTGALFVGRNLQVQQKKKIYHQDKQYHCR